jgi:hypothetical protein
LGRNIPKLGISFPIMGIHYKEVVMFMCKECHQKEEDDGICIGNHFSTSYGKCELCGKVDSCVDCTAYKYVERKNDKSSNS